MWPNFSMKTLNNQYCSGICYFPTKFEQYTFMLQNSTVDMNRRCLSDHLVWSPVVCCSDWQFTTCTEVIAPVVSLMAGQLEQWILHNLMVISIQDVKTPVNASNNSPSQDFFYYDDQSTWSLELLLLGSSNHWSPAPLIISSREIRQSLVFNVCTWFNHLSGWRTFKSQDVCSGRKEHSNNWFCRHGLNSLITYFFKMAYCSSLEFSP